MEEISSLIKPTSSYPKDCSLFLPTLLYSMELLCSNFQVSSNVLNKFSFMIYYILMGFFFGSFDSSWLQREVTQYFPGEETYLGMSKEDLCSTIFDVLTASNSDEKLQNDVSTEFVLKIK